MSVISAQTLGEVLMDQIGELADPADWEVTAWLIPIPMSQSPGELLIASADAVQYVRRDLGDGVLVFREEAERTVIAPEAQVRRITLERPQ